MEQDIKLLQNVKRLMIARYPRFAGEIANANLKFKTDLPYHTAATDGKNIYFDPSYLASLSDDDKLFIIAHELMHIKFEHMFRMTDKNGKMRDPEIWNIATDAIINANLERDGFKIKEGYVNMPEALEFNAEEFYEKLLKERRQQNQQSGNGQNQQNGNQSQTGEGQSNDQQNGSQDQNSNQQSQSEQGQGENSKEQNSDSNEQNSSQSGQNVEQQNQNGQGSNGQIMDDHSLWEEAFEKSRNDKGQKDNSSNSVYGSKTSSKNTKLDSNRKEIEFKEAKFDEKFQFQENRRERREIARQRIERMKDEGLRKSETGNIELGEVGEAKAILDWKLLLRREVEKAETIWSQRRSIAENNYAYRLEENDIEDEAETEVMIDVSGSVSLEMVKAFLRQLKPILKESKLRVGCFNAKYWGMVEIKTNRDIDNFKIPQAARDRMYAWTEDWDLAVRSFTKKREINKIVFTDGEPCPGTMPKSDLKGTNVIWLVYGNRNFNPCCGKVIQISSRDLQNLSLINKEISSEDEFTM